jgi:hypothetical protein
MKPKDQRDITRDNDGGFELARIHLTGEGGFDIEFTLPENEADPEQVASVWGIAVAELIMAVGRGIAEIQGISEGDARELMWRKCTELLGEGLPLKGGLEIDRPLDS